MNPILNNTPNNIMQNIGKNIGQIKQAWGLLKNANNPQAMISQIIKDSPNAKRMREVVSQYGGDYEKAFRETAKQMGIDPDEFINNLK